MDYARFSNPFVANQAPYSVEVRNELTGALKTIRKLYETLEDARAYVEREAERSRRFVEYVILDKRSAVVERYRGRA